MRTRVLLLSISFVATAAWGQSSPQAARGEPDAEILLEHRLLSRRHARWRDRQGTLQNRPMTYSAGDKQYVAVSASNSLFVFGLP